jgi:uncharacterized membrane protein
LLSKFLKSDNSIEVTVILIQKLSAKITRTSISERVRNHVDYPSLNAISETLTNFKLNNYAIDINVEQLTEVPTPCLAALHIEGGIFVVINEIKDGFVEWIHTERGKQIDEISSFSEKWSGVILLTEVNEETGENDFHNIRRREILAKYGTLGLWIGGIGVLISTITLSVTSLPNLPILLFWLVFIKLLGIIISIILLWYLLDKQNPFLKSICRVGKNANCNSVLNSKAAMFLGVLSWSEIGFFYFTGSFLALLFGLSNQNIITYLTFTSILAFPYTLFSIYYQGVVLKNWCILCLSVQFLLWCEFGLFFWQNGLNIPTFVSFHESLLIFSTFTLPVITWFISKPIIQSAFEANTLKNTLMKFQNDTDIFNQILMKQPRMFEVFSEMKMVDYPYSGAKNIITIVTNPYCPSCATKHKLLKEIVEENLYTVRYQIVFLATSEINNARADFVRHLLSLDISLQIDALDFWFNMEEREYKKWALFYPVDKIDPETSKIVNAHDYWCYRSEISETPTIFINGYKLPDVYQLEDIKRIASRIFM